MADETPKLEQIPISSETIASDDASATNSPKKQPQPSGSQASPGQDLVMSDAPIDHAASPVPAAFAPSPAPVRNGTPAHGSRSASVHPDAGLTMPSESVPNGDPTRRYLNTKVTGVLLDGMKLLAKEQSVPRPPWRSVLSLTECRRPNDPLRVLGEYLLQRSKELDESS
ncbi:hypothetical protein DCS_03853 [Drechmeria coniospora]|uniref:Dpy-30 motif protein n=1 Tax=Drechmeria coniospora TaxID=98403 RepID=A0A151GIC2_DRECN|nr:hypothetical protein DCS_03853 [Drechmeria coniospora]KYK56847.1 hypothetical protein DCS_03853 [Drechmeria coniospora]ODA78844.1 hypothetical protein RJ55_06228 [Drechmeria coniospora]